MKSLYSLWLFFAFVSVGETRRRTSTTGKPSYENSSEEYKRTPPSRQNQFLIGAFNIKKFGLPKVSNESVMETIIKIITRYDIIAITEITDRTERAIKNLMERLNFVSRHPYHYVISERVGRTNNKEQYALIFKSELIHVKNHFLYDDSANDIFEREPEILQIEFKGYDNDLALVNIHVKPSQAVAEIDALVDVQSWIERRLKIKDVVILGDLNADCSYVSRKAWRNIRLRTMEQFHWLIGDEVDTTVGRTNCAYDRIIVSGPSVTKAVIPNSAQAFLFDTAFNLDKSQALQVSDHYPVEIKLGSLKLSKDILLIDRNTTGMSDNVYQPQTNSIFNTSLISLDSDNKLLTKIANETTSKSSFQKAKNRLAKLVPKWVKKTVGSWF